MLPSRQAGIALAPLRGFVQPWERMKLPSWFLSKWPPKPRRFLPPEYSDPFRLKPGTLQTAGTSRAAFAPSVVRTRETRAPGANRRRRIRQPMREIVQSHPSLAPQHGMLQKAEKL